MSVKEQCKSTTTRQVSSDACQLFMMHMLVAFAKKQIHQRKMSCTCFHLLVEYANPHASHLLMFETNVDLSMHYEHVNPRQLISLQ